MLDSEATLPSSGKCSLLPGRDRAPDVSWRPGVCPGKAWVVPNWGGGSEHRMRPMMPIKRGAGTRRFAWDYFEPARSWNRCACRARPQSRTLVEFRHEPCSRVYRRCEIRGLLMRFANGSMTNRRLAKGHWRRQYCKRAPWAFLQIGRHRQEATRGDAVMTRP